jgi:hypothetical protein
MRYYIVPVAKYHYANYKCAPHSGREVARTLGSWIRISLKAWMSVLCSFILCVGRGLATD